MDSYSEYDAAIVYAAILDRAGISDEQVCLGGGKRRVLKQLSEVRCLPRRTNANAMTVAGAVAGVAFPPLLALTALSRGSYEVGTSGQTGPFDWDC